MARDIDTKRRATFKNTFTYTKIENHSNGEPNAYGEGLSCAKAMVNDDPHNVFSPSTSPIKNHENLKIYQSAFRSCFQYNKALNLSDRLFCTLAQKSLYKRDSKYYIGSSSIYIGTSNWNGNIKRPYDPDVVDVFTGDLMEAANTIISKVINDPNLSSIPDFELKYIAPRYIETSSNANCTMDNLVGNGVIWLGSGIKPDSTFWLADLDDITIVNSAGDNNPVMSYKYCKVVSGKLYIEYTGGEVTEIDLVGDGDTSIKKVTVNVSQPIKNMYLKDYIVNVHDKRTNRSLYPMNAIASNPSIGRNGGSFYGNLIDETNGWHGSIYKVHLNDDEGTAGLIQIQPTTSFDVKRGYKFQIAHNINYIDSNYMEFSKLRNINFCIFFVDNNGGGKCVKYENNLRAISSIDDSKFRPNTIISKDLYPDVIEQTFIVSPDTLFASEILYADVLKPFVTSTGKKLNVLGAHRFYNKKKLYGCIASNTKATSVNIFYVAYIDETEDNLVIDYIGSKFK